MHRHHRQSPPPSCLSTEVLHIGLSASKKRVKAASDAIDWGAHVWDHARQEAPLLFQAMSGYTRVVMVVSRQQCFVTKSGGKVPEKATHIWDYAYLHVSHNIWHDSAWILGALPMVWLFSIRGVNIFERQPRPGWIARSRSCSVSSGKRRIRSTVQLEHAYIYPISIWFLCIPIQDLDNNRLQRDLNRGTCCSLWRRRGGETDWGRECGQRMNVWWECFPRNRIQSTYITSISNS